MGGDWSILWETIKGLERRNNPNPNLNPQVEAQSTQEQSVSDASEEEKDWKAIMNKLPEELQYEVTTFIPSKTLKITDAFVKWYIDENEYPEEEFLGIKMDPELPSEEGNLGIETAKKLS